MRLVMDATSVENDPSSSSLFTVFQTQGGVAVFDNNDGWVAPSSEAVLQAVMRQVTLRFGSTVNTIMNTNEDYTVATRDMDASEAPSAGPSGAHSVSPSAAHSTHPSAQHSSFPSESMEPSASPTAAHSENPSVPTATNDSTADGPTTTEPNDSTPPPGSTAGAKVAVAIDDDPPSNSTPLSLMTMVLGCGALVVFILALFVIRKTVRKPLDGDDDSDVAVDDGKFIEINTTASSSWSQSSSDYEAVGKLARDDGAVNDEEEEKKKEGRVGASSSRRGLFGRRGYKPIIASGSGSSRRSTPKSVTTTTMIGGGYETEVSLLDIARNINTTTVKKDMLESSSYSSSSLGSISIKNGTLLNTPTSGNGNNKKSMERSQQDFDLWMNASKTTKKTAGGSYRSLNNSEHDDGFESDTSWDPDEKEFDSSARVRTIV